ANCEFFQIGQPRIVVEQRYRTFAFHAGAAFVAVDYLFQLLLFEVVEDDLPSRTNTSRALGRCGGRGRHLPLSDCFCECAALNTYFEELLVVMPVERFSQVSFTEDYRTFFQGHGFSLLEEFVEDEAHAARGTSFAHGLPQLAAALSEPDGLLAQGVGERRHGVKGEG